ncbi:MAG: VanW family protein [Candidatus Shapirobacteria bacterium]
MEKKKSIALAIQIGKMVIFVFFISVLFAPLFSVIGFKLAYQEKIYPGLNAGLWSLNKLSLTEAENLLTQKVQEQSFIISLKNEQEKYELDLEKLGLRFFPQKTALLAYSWGRENNFLKNIEKQYTAFRQEQKIPLVFDFDQAQFKAAIATISAQVNQPFVPTVLSLENEDLQVREGQLGLELDILDLKKIIDQKLSAGSWQEPIDLSFKITGWLPDQRQIENTKNEALKLKGKSIILSSSSQNFILPDKELVEFLDFNQGWQKEKIKAWAESLAVGLEKEPQNALFQFENNRVTEFKPAAAGFRLSQEQTASLILRTLSNMLAGSSAQAVLELPLEKIEPEITTNQANNLGITGLTAKGESWFFHSIASRIHNIQTGTERLNGILIKPGEEFSFNKAIGEISAKTGYQQAWIIKEGRTVLGDGGGVCQISTTLFRAALKAGLPILERHAHAYRVSYYEENSKLGIDATVFSPSVDLRFKNNYPCHLLIQTEFDPASSYLAFNLYGCPDERIVTLDNFKTWDVVSPPPASYVDDPALPAGTLKQIDFAAGGAKASFDWKVEKNGEIVNKQTFYSAYRPWQAVYLRGTGAN